jgi:hypothetical protein
MEENMKKETFLEKIKEEKPDTGGCGFFVDDIEVIQGGPAYYRCKYENRKWIIYMPSERGGENSIFETKSEDEVFEHLYEIIQRNVRLYKKRVMRDQK